MQQLRQEKLIIPRRFTAFNDDVYSNINFIERTSKTTEYNGQVLETFTVIMPDSWSQIAVDILTQKYFRRRGIPQYLKKVYEEGVPQWLQRSVEDTEKMGIELGTYSGEDDARMVIHRLAGGWTYWGWKGGYFQDEDSARAFYDEIRHMLIYQKAAPNSPQFFNTGIHWAYGILGGESQGHYYYNSELEKVVLSTSSYERPQVHACFIQSVEDNLIEEGGILDLALRESRIFKFGSGSGTNFSPIRAKGEPLSCGGTSSGLMSFLKIGDVIGGVIKSGGATRRAAKMVTLDYDHPEIMDYTSWKLTEENKIISLMVGSRIIQDSIDKILQAFKESGNANIKTNPKLFEAMKEAYRNKIPISYLGQILSLLSQGITDLKWEVFTSDFNGNGYGSVSGQNSNNSVRVSHEFLEAVRHDDNVELKYRTDTTKTTTVKARKIWNDMSRAAWSCGDPGIQYDDNINDWHTCPNSGRINGSNPCSEYMFLDDTACNLASMNLVAFEQEDGALDVSAFVHATRLWTIILEISVYMAQYPSKKIAQLSHDFRTLGLGYANLGALLMRSGMPYDSDEGRAYSAYITALMHGASCEMSAEMAAKFGPFPGFKANREDMLRVMQNHRRAVIGEPCQGVRIQPMSLNKDYISEEQFRYLSKLWDRVIDKGHKYGYRNAQTTLLAPTGTIRLLMDCATSGIEPEYNFVTFKTLTGGGYMKIVNHSVITALQRLNYSDSEIHAILEYMLGTSSLDKCNIIGRDELVKRGLNDEEVNLINKALPSAFSLESVFSKWIIGDAIFKRLKISPEKYNNESGFSLLRFLGFTSDQIRAADLVICGHQNLEHAPHIKPEHIPIFDCSNKNGDGQRAISPEAHIMQMAAVQPFLSGAISKTVNTPESATIEDLSNLMLLGEEVALKALAIFRDKSKQSSVYSSKIAQELEQILSKSSADPVSSSRAEREVLPPQRSGYTQRVSIGGQQNIFYHTTGENQAGDIREIFVSGGDYQGAAYKELMHAFVKLCSISLQHGTPLEVIINSFAYTEFPPNGLVTGDPNIRFARSWIDYIMRQIGIHYRSMNHLGHVFEEHEAVGKNDTQNSPHHKVQDGYTGEICMNPECRSVRMRRDGACSFCEDCYSTTGCG